VERKGLEPSTSALRTPRFLPFSPCFIHSRIKFSLYFLSFFDTTSSFRIKFHAGCGTLRLLRGGRSSPVVAYQISGAGVKGNELSHTGKDKWAKAGFRMVLSQVMLAKTSQGEMHYFKYPDTKEGYEMALAEWAMIKDRKPFSRPQGRIMDVSDRDRREIAEGAIRYHEAKQRRENKRKPWKLLYLVLWGSKWRRLDRKQSHTPHGRTIADCTLES